MNYMMESVVIWVLLLHWCGDFILQTRWMADNKSKSWEALTLHVFVYGCTLWVGLAITGQWHIHAISKFVVINFIIHFFVDIITSKCTRAALSTKSIHTFFAIIGFDQFLHSISLLLTLPILGSPLF